MIRVGSVCSGVGALDLAFESAGFVTAWQAEIDAYASKVLAKRWPGVPNVGDWTDMDAWMCGPPWESDIDLLIGGIPCQGNSVAGRREGIDDERNLAPAFFRLVDALKPRLFVIENVGGILTASDGDMFASIVEAADALGYSVEWDICSAAYAGAPHRRERVFIVGRSDGRLTWHAKGGQPSLFPGRPQSWPKAGRWTDGFLHERERQWPTPKAGAQVWRTPNARDGHPRGTEHPEKRLADGHQPGLPDQVEHGKPWTTPRAGDSKQGPSSTAKHLESGDIMLTDEVRLPEPAAGRLSADWAETLQGWPVGWTDLSCDEPEPRPYPRAMACEPFDWPTPVASEHRDCDPPPMKEGVKWWLQSRASRNTNALTQHPLYGASPQGDWEPPRLVEAVKGDQRRNRLRCIGNGVELGTGRIVAESIMRSLK